METMVMEQLVTIFFLLFNLVDATRTARIIIEIAVVLVVGLGSKERITSDLFKEFRLQAVVTPL